MDFEQVAANLFSKIKSWRHEGHPANGNKQSHNITRCRVDIWEPSNTALVA